VDKAGCHADYSGVYSAVSNNLPEVTALNLNSLGGIKKILKKSCWQVCHLRVGCDLADIDNFGGDRGY